MKAYRITRPDLGDTRSCVYRDWATVEAEFDGAEVGDKITVELVEMTKEQLDNLPDFEGW